MMTPDERIAYEAADSPSLLDEKKYLEERRRRLETSLHDHVEELKDRGRQVGHWALLGTATVAGVWLLTKALGAARGQKRHRKALAAKPRLGRGALTPGSRAPEPDTPSHAADTSWPPPLPRAASAAPQAAAFARAAAPEAAPYAPYAPFAPTGPSMLNVFLQSEAGKMMTNQLVAIAMVFITKKLQEVLQLPANADIGGAKESHSASYKIIEPQDATVVDGNGNA